VTKWACFLGLTFAVVVRSVGCGGTKAPENTTATESAASTPNSAATSAPAAPAERAARFTEVTIPSGTTLQLDLVTAVGSDTSRVEEPVRATIRTPVTINGQVVVPVGSEVSGVVSQAEESGRVKGRASIGVRFNSLRTAGQTYDIRTSGYSAMAEATKGDDAKKIAIGAGAGAAVGALLGGGSGAAKGAAIGGAGGTGAVLATRGKEVRLGPGVAETVRLSAPVRVRVRS